MNPGNPRRESTQFPIGEGVQFINKISTYRAFFRNLFPTRKPQDGRVFRPYEIQLKIIVQKLFNKKNLIPLHSEFFRIRAITLLKTLVKTDHSECQQYNN
jgi:hypothetical protein